MRQSVSSHSIHRVADHVLWTFEGKMKVPYLVDVMQQGDIIKKRYVVWLVADSACPKEARQFVQSNVLGKGIYDPEAGDTIVAEPLDMNQVLWIVW